MSSIGHGHVAIGESQMVGAGFGDVAIEESQGLDKGINIAVAESAKPHSAGLYVAQRLVRGEDEDGSYLGWMLLVPDCERRLPKCSMEMTEREVTMSGRNRARQR